MCHVYVSYVCVKCMSCLCVECVCTVYVSNVCVVNVYIMCNRICVCPHDVRCVGRKLMRIFASGGAIGVMLKSKLP